MRALTPFLLKLGLYYPLRRLVLRLHNRGRPADNVFSEIYRDNRWQGTESRSGEGSSLGQTQVIIEALPSLLRRNNVRAMLDIPCGDFHWMSNVDLAGIDYVGGDIVPDLIATNNGRFTGAGRRFEVLDLCEDRLSAVDLVFCRDCMVHLPFSMLAKAISNVRSSGATYLMATTFTGVKTNHDIALGDFRPLNMRLPPFNFPEPLELLLEHCTEFGGKHGDKAMGLWRVNDIPEFRQ